MTACFREIIVFCWWFLAYCNKPWQEQLPQDHPSSPQATGAHSAHKQPQCRQASCSCLLDIGKTKSFLIKHYQKPHNLCQSASDTDMLPAATSECDWLIIQRIPARERSQGPTGTPPPQDIARRLECTLHDPPSPHGSQAPWEGPGWSSPPSSWVLPEKPPKYTTANKESRQSLLNQWSIAFWESIAFWGDGLRMEA